jgi:hypothetical protein
MGECREHRYVLFQIETVVFCSGNVQLMAIVLKINRADTKRGKVQ